MAADAPTYRTLVTSFTDFLTVAIHTILYERAIYPETSFLLARKYNFPVRQNRHPKVCEWINDAVAAVENELLKCTVKHIAVVIYTPQNQPLERYVFDVSRFPSLSAKDVDLPMQRLANGESMPVLPKVDMEEQFRATMSKLTNCGTKLKPLPDACTFTIAIELKVDREAPVSHPQPWVPVQPRLDDDEKEVSKSAKALPVRAVAAGEMVFETWIEETNWKPVESSTPDSDSVGTPKS
ncbi:hypothetical protein BAUCODRAFT_78804 [Baudoinia panamericana UAMH 10762]|uniref:HORMA domain-containing protein n=1 Tax=Baudoinia panamericana (strain UAMH 10762) TaxID=717646 RepID=M2MYC1_BAUPA|nr:uncharacterized protein BAUCODRAFT_78804 [Baudoinia panamericana UAMH 10762]EMC91664.1 hypothetical protein BAUCODRAFT_78804 [Baudoinia panamericana UAMH 10762]